MLNERRAHCIEVFDNGMGLSAQLRAGLERHNSSLRFVVSRGTHPQELDARQCDLVVVGIGGQVSQGLGLLAECRGLYPCLPALALVCRGDISAAVAATKAGAADCLESPWEMKRLVSAIMAILGEGQPHGRHIYRILTSAEVRVFHLIMAGRTSRQMACQLHRSQRTIETHRRNIMRKLGLAGSVDLVRYAIAAGFFGPGGIDWQP